jgi:hypothetical protein
MGPGPSSIAEAVNPLMERHYSLVFNFEPHNHIRVGDVGFFNEGRFRRVFEPGDDVDDVPTLNCSVCLRKSTRPKRNFTRAGDSFLYQWGDMVHDQLQHKKPMVASDGVQLLYDSEKVLFGGKGPALVLFATNNTVESLTGPILPRPQVERWAAAVPGLSVIVRTVHSGPMLLVAQSQRSEPHLLTLQSHTINGVTRVLDVQPRGDSDYFDYCYFHTHSLKEPSAIPLIQVMPMPEFIRTHYV